jgi:predicted dehydrogenase
VIALVGGGAAALAYHLPALARHRGVMARLVLVERDASRGAEVAARYGVRTVPTLEEVAGEVDAAIIATPHESHFPLALACLREGVHVLCEKPLATSAEEAGMLVEEAAARGLVLAVNNTRRLIPSYRKIHSLIATGAIGRVERLEINWGEVFSWPTFTGGYFKGSGSPGVLLDLGAHALDLACWWLPGAPAVRSCLDDACGGAAAVCSVDLEVGGAEVRINLSWLSELENRVRVEGEQGKIECGLYEFDSLTVSRPRRRSRVIYTSRAPRQYERFAEPLVDNFVRAVAGEEAPLIPAAEVIPSLAAMDACRAVRRRFDLPWERVPEGAGCAPC